MVVFRINLLPLAPKAAILSLSCSVQVRSGVERQRESGRTSLHVEHSNVSRVGDASEEKYRGHRSQLHPRMSKCRRLTTSCLSWSSCKDNCAPNRLHSAIASQYLVSSGVLTLPRTIRPSMTCSQSSFIWSVISSRAEP